VRTIGASKIYRMGEVDVPALADVSLEIAEGEYVMIVGSSGSGKSTLLNLIGGMDRPTAGQVHFRGIDISSFSDRRLTLYRREHVGFVFQFYNLIPTLTALENVQVAAEMSPRSIDPAEALDLVGLAKRAGHFPAQLSGGEQQRVAIARAIAGDPSMLLCDEPTGALDTTNSREVLSLLADLNSRLRKTLIVITHETALTAMADRIIQLHDGSVAGIRRNDRRASADELLL
jgi:putative ABC transport system ATP-binding protein